MGDFYRSIASNVKVFLSFHAFGQYVLYPYGHTRDPAPNNDDLGRMAAAYTSRAAVNYGTQYTFGPTSTLLCK